MISPEKIEEWIREAQERPGSAALIIHYISKRLSDLSQRNEELQTENIELRIGRKVEEYESRIASLEYQVDLLKRQLGSGGAVLPDAFLGGGSEFPVKVGLSAILFLPQGQVLRVPLPAELVSGAAFAQFHSLKDAPRLGVTGDHEELLMAFDMGRTVSQPVTALPAVNPAQPLNWENAALFEPRGVEELVTAAPVGRMALYEFCVQVTRRGFVKKIQESFLESYVAKNFIGSGVRQQLDKAFDLVLCGKEDWIVLASQEGVLVCVELSRLPFTIEEVLRLSATDHIIAAFAVPRSTGSTARTSVLVVTNNGKAVHREVSWLEPVVSFKTSGQALLSKARRDTGMRIAGAALVGEQDWGVALHLDGRLSLHRMSDLFAQGAVLVDGQPAEGILSFVTFAKE